jgi:hypothetical protein
VARKFINLKQLRRKFLKKYKYRKNQAGENKKSQTNCLAFFGIDKLSVY